MSSLSPDEVRKVSGPLANELQAKYFKLLQSKGPAFAAVAMFDACSAVLSAALLPFSPAARLRALDVLRLEIEEQADDFQEEIREFAKQEAAQ
jgi:hypothetical protein